ncbi:glycosyltransferase family 4 protein [Priestia filamentosa]|uniref:glycosyltransferase family 4 protein n=1 Tax=Priestia filamentosa TaxID=1402861 RepID=UPI00397DF0A1
MKKILFTATVSQSHIKVFHIPYLKWFKEQGYEVHVASRGDNNVPFCDEFFELPFERSPLKLNNLITYGKLKKIIDKNNYELIHCHTPMGGVLTRIAARKARKKGTKVIYTAHGFHFFKGASNLNWKLYFPMEKWLSRYTDCLITINQEDYEAAIENDFKAKQIEFIKGVGIDLDRFTPQNDEVKRKLRREYGYKDNDLILMYAAELSHRKHQDLLINVVSKLKNKFPNIKLLLAGTGDLELQYKKQVENLDLNTNVDFLGYRKDINKLMLLADIAVSSSRQEGLPVNIMEAMATGLPLVVTDCRGNRDLVTDGENGFIIELNDINSFVQSLEKLAKSSALRKSFGEKSLELTKEYCLEVIKEQMASIYALNCKSIRHIDQES